MWFVKPPNQDRNAACSECTWSAPHHHPCCSHHRESATLVDPFGEDYTHLVGPPAMSQYKPPYKPRTDRLPDPAFDGLLSADDRILLRGMRISWQAQAW